MQRAETAGGQVAWTAGQRTVRRAVAASNRARFRSFRSVRGGSVGRSKKKEADGRVHKNLQIVALSSPFDPGLDTRTAGQLAPLGSLAAGKART